jgi:DNA recombination protein RmuC
MLNEQLFLLVLIAVLAFGCGCVIAWFYLSGRLNSARESLARNSAQLEAHQKLASEKDTAYRQMSEQLKESFNSLAVSALKSNSTEFLRLARENLGQFQVKAEGELEKREKAVENMVKPIQEALSRTEKQIRQMENERQKAHGALSKHLETMAESHRLLQSETRNLVQALRRPEVRGQWGEMTLKRLAELAGMVEHCDFVEQESTQTDEGKLRPDMVVRMPGRREIVVDAKTPLDAYLSAIEAISDSERTAHLEHHARNVRERIRELSSKAYWQQFPDSPDFVVLFIPGDQFLSAALDIDHKLLEDALSQHVILATPTSFVALLRAVAYGWRQESLAENAEAIRKVGTLMYDRLTTFADHLARLGRSLDSSVDTFNRAVGSFDTRILPSARKFIEMGITAKKEPPELEQIERATRRVESCEESEKTH